MKCVLDLLFIWMIIICWFVVAVVDMNSKYKTNELNEHTEDTRHKLHQPQAIWALKLNMFYGVYSVESFVSYIFGVIKALFFKGF